MAAAELMAGLPEPSPRHLPAAAAVVVGAGAVQAGRRLPVVGDWITGQPNQVLGTGAVASAVLSG